MAEDFVHPSFIIAGAAKSGTTYLADLLGSNPRFCISDPKEPHFFSNPDKFGYDPKVYAKCFSHCTQGQILGEASTGYMIFNGTLANLDRYGVCPKFVFLLRDPISRMESHYWHLRGRGLENRAILRAVREEADLIPTDHAKTYSYYLQSSSYYSNINTFVEHFGRHRVHVMIFERLIASPRAELACLAQFLGAPGAEFALKNRNTNPAIRYRNRALSGFLLGGSPLKRKLKSILPVGWRQRLKNGALKRMEERTYYPPLGCSEREWFRRMLADEVEGMRWLLGESIPEWENFNDQ